MYRFCFCKVATKLSYRFVCGQEINRENTVARRLRQTGMVHHFAAGVLPGGLVGSSGMPLLLERGEEVHRNRQGAGRRPRLAVAGWGMLGWGCSWCSLLKDRKKGEGEGERKRRRKGECVRD